MLLALPTRRTAAEPGHHVVPGARGTATDRRDIRGVRRIYLRTTLFTDSSML
ncbi:hypothetical protein [Nocardia barduliensis]|uniref:hypothetical protein n=1 Tax=Nocardia barduliensis TaxID=2736643 RepID=UPI00157408D4|nr:hypothetical protein [Nocardia barduliensis]